MSGCLLDSLKIGERQRPNTFKIKSAVLPPVNHEDSWKQKSQFPDISFVSADTIVADADETAKAWLSHPANKMQLKSLQKEFDEDGDGVTSKAEFKKLLAAVGSGTDSNILFDTMDADGDGFLTEAEIKALGQDKQNRGRKA